MTWIVLNYCLAELFLYMRKVRCIVTEKLPSGAIRQNQLSRPKNRRRLKGKFSPTMKFPLRSLRVIFLPLTKVYKTNTNARGKTEKSFAATWVWITEHVENLFLGKRNHRSRQMSTNMNHSGWVCRFFFRTFIFEGKILTFIALSLLITGKTPAYNAKVSSKNTIECFCLHEKFFRWSFFRPADLFPRSSWKKSNNDETFLVNSGRVDANDR